MKKYNPSKIEKKWHTIWDKWSQNDAEQTQKNAEQNDIQRNSALVQRGSATLAEKPKYYMLDMFPYPSGDGLHMGHTESYTASDIMYRFKKLQGYDVLHPQGFDSFGLPAENYAIKTGVHPKETTKTNANNYIEQMKMLGLGHDLDHMVYTSNPDYYKWTQWLFGKFFEGGLVEQKTDKINWCPSCNTGIANEQVENGKCERCKTDIEQKEIPGWFFKITDFADELIDDLDTVDWPEATKKNQKAWIGKSVGSKIKFNVVCDSESRDEEGDCKNRNQHFSQNGAEQTQNNAEIKDDKLLYKELTYKIRGAMFNVKKLVGTGHKESVYHKALEIEFKKQGLAFESEKRIDIEYEGEKVGTYQPDFVIEDKVLIELKAIPKIGKQQLNQAWTYLKGSDYKLALLVNYSPAELEIKRMVYDTARNKNNNSPSALNTSSACSAFVPHNSATSIEVFTTRPDTLFGATYMVLSPEHALIQNSKFKIQNYDEVAEYVKAAQKKTEMERMENKEKTGIKLEGLMAINPAIAKMLSQSQTNAEQTQKNAEKVPRSSASVLHNSATSTEVEIPIFIADYVLGGYGTGAIMAVPAHDERDYEFAKKFNIEIKQVISGGDIIKEAYTGEGKLINSGKFSRLSVEDAKEEITKFVGGEMTSNYRLRDWSISRQRYWGCPIPMVYSPEGEPKFVGEENLPWLLPEDVDFMPDGTAPLAKSKELKERTEEIFGKGWTPEVDTMDTFVDSSWYFLRYPDTENEKEFCSAEKLKRWMPVDLYIGGAEHTYMHLLYARFFVKAMKKLGLIDFNEPFTKLRHQGMVLDKDGVKMSKSKGNVVNPNDMVEIFGADATRMYMMFAGPLEDEVAFKQEGVKGVFRFLEKVWRLAQEKDLIDCGVGRCGDVPKEIPPALHKTIKKVGEDIENLNFNTAIAQMMIFVNTATKHKVLPKGALKNFLIVLSPFAPHVTEELWAQLGEKESIFVQEWPEYNPEMVQDNSIEMPIQINGKVRDKMKVAVDISEEEAKEKALASEKIQKYTENKEIKKIIFVKGRLISIVI